MMLRQSPALLVLPFFVTACQPASEEQQKAPADSSQSASRRASAPQEPAPETADRAAPAPAAPEPSVAKNDVKTAAAVKLAVDAEGLRLVDRQTGSTRPLAFGLSSDAVLAPLERLRGPAGQGTNPECRIEYANWADGLSLTFRKGKFVGWALDGRSGGAISTMAGLATGSTRKALGAYDYKVSETTLGSEFSAGGLNGLLSSAAGDATVTNLWAGEVCLAR